MSDGNITETKADKGSNPWLLCFADAVAENPTVVRVADPPGQAPPRPWLARPGIAPGFVPAAPTPGGENVFTPSLERMQRPQQTYVPPSAFAPATPSAPDTPLFFSPQQGPAPVAAPFAAPEAPDARAGKPLESGQAQPFAQANPFAPPQSNDTKPAQTPVVPSNPSIRPDLTIPPIVVPPNLQTQPTESTQWRATPHIVTGDPGGAPDWNTYIKPQIQGQKVTPIDAPLVRRPAASAPGSPANPGLNPLSDDKRGFIDNSLHVRTSMAGYLGTGAGTGALVGSAEWCLDKKLFATPDATHTGILAWWERHSPTLKYHENLTSRLEEVTAEHAAAASNLAVAEAALTNHAENLIHMIGSYNEQVKLLADVAGEDPAKKLLLAQREFIANPALRSSQKAILEKIGTAEEVEAGTKLFVRDSPEVKNLLDLALGGQEKSTAEIALANKQTEYNGIKELLTTAEKEGAGTLRGRAFNGAVKGLGISAATLAAGYGIDKLGSYAFGYTPPKSDGYTRFLMDGVAVPAILLSNLSPRVKFAAAGLAFVSARVADYCAGTGASVETSTFLRPNTLDAVGMTAAAMAPVDGGTKAKLIAGAWAIGRAWNEIGHYTGWDGGHPAQLLDTLENTFNHDQLTHTEASFDRAVEAGKTLGKENEAALERQEHDWLEKLSSTEPLTHMRGNALLTRALGEFRLEEGSRLDIFSHADKKDRILKGSNYDFGGEATSWLRMSAGSLGAAQDYAKAHKGDAAYIQQLKNEESKVTAKLDVIYGKHDMQGVFDELVNQSRVHSGDMQQALNRMKNALSVLNTTDKRYIAKSNRDLAIGYLAEAAYMKSCNNGEEALIMYNDATQYLQKSKQADASAPDLQAIELIRSKVAKGIQGAVSAQYESNWDNPWQLNTPNYDIKVK